MTWFLVILFLTAGGGAEIKEGWYPLAQPNEYVCGKSVEQVISYLDSIGAVAVAYCQLIELNPESISSRGENV